MTDVMLGLSGLLGLAGAIVLGTIVVAAFREEVKQGVLCLFIPGYVLYYGWKELEKPKLVAIGLAASLGAGLLGTFSSSFEPNLTIDDAATSAPGLEDDGFGSFDDLDEPLD